MFSGCIEKQHRAVMGKLNESIEENGFSKAPSDIHLTKSLNTHFPGKIFISNFFQKKIDFQFQ